VTGRVKASFYDNPVVLRQEIVGLRPKYPLGQFLEKMIARSDFFRPPIVARATR
jgi:hypothetical protein